MDSGTIVLLMVPCMMAIIMLGIPFYFATGSVGLFFGLALFGPSILATTAIRVYTFMTDPTFVAVPMFVAMGIFLSTSGVAELLFNGVYVLFGRVRGGLLFAVIVMGTLLGACTGVVAGTIASMALMALPVMLKRGYKPSIATAVISASGCLGQFVPPSVMLIIYGMFANISIGKLYAAAFGPSLLMAGTYLVYCLVRSFLQKDLAPAAPPEELTGVTFGKKMSLLAKGVLPVAALIFAVLGTIYTGIATPTEAAGVGAFGAVVLALVYRKLTLKSYTKGQLATFRAAGMIGGNFLGSMLFVSVFLGAGGGKTIGNFFMAMGLSQTITMAILLLSVMLMAMIMDLMTIIFVTIPVFTPILQNFGVNPLWFAMLYACATQICLIMPPLGPGLYLLRPFAPPEVKTIDMYKGVVPFIGCNIVCLTLVWVFPSIALWLPGLTVRGG